MTKYVIFDLDNCLADDSARIPLIDWSKTGDQRYAAYHAAAGEDPVCENTRSVLNTHSEAGHIPIFLTARPFSIRHITEHWIKTALGVNVQNRTCYPFLLMRGIGDNRSSVRVKEEQLFMLINHCIDPKNIVAAYDDHQDIVDMYKKGFGIDAHRLCAHTLDAYSPPEGFVDSTMGAIRIDEVNQVSVKQDLSNAKKLRRADEILHDMAATFRERNAVYGSNYRMVAKLVAVLFPDGVPPELVVTDQWHLFELKLVKLSRFAISGLKHKDSIHDDAVYSAMIESIIEEQEAMDEGKANKG